MIPFPVNLYDDIKRIARSEAWRHLHRRGGHIDMADVDDQAAHAVVSIVEMCATRDAAPDSWLPYARLVMRRALITRARSEFARRWSLKDRRRDVLSTEQRVDWGDADNDDIHPTVESEAALVDRIAAEQIEAAYLRGNVHAAARAAKGARSTAANAVHQHIQVVLKHYEAERRPHD